ncbi:Hpt domain-containing protein [Achromobacter deleyi]|uniref:Hpt domain-containing protein n=1 Tax=Achromobacter deleyi TaxID=1353891 RepID=UPI001491943F|nr:Hpt domain-containing protein [Achromobacter deleyi]QVQ26458.1 Hpt domain-containing protein [Achromobacter deleyi]UIP22028.1 Hpt domain-containing protein [Achromobacter deleyi]
MTTKPPRPIPEQEPPGAGPDALGAIPLRYRQLFIDALTLDLAALEHALERRDAAEAAQTLHRIRGAFLSLQIPGPGSDSDALEHAIKTTGLSEAVQAEVRDVIISLRSLVRRA